MKKLLPFSVEQVKSWTDQYPTPFYVYDEQGIRKTVSDVYKSFAWNPGFCEYFAVKATPTPAILRMMAEMGCGADCSSIPEIVLAKGSGISGQRIMFTSNETSATEYRKIGRASCRERV